MRLLELSSALVWAAAVAAFQDTSPFFLFSTVEIPEESLHVPQITSSSSLLESLKQQLAPCNAASYFILYQPGVEMADFAAASTSPTLRHLVDPESEGDGVKSSYTVSEVVGEVDPAEIQRYLAEHCKADITKLDGATGHFAMAMDVHPKVMRFDYPTLPVYKENRILQLQRIDAFMSSVLDVLPLSSPYVFMYVTTSGPPTESHLYQDPSGPEQERVDLRRRSSLDGAESQKRQDGNNTLVDGPLFERYQFLTPGLFMGLLTGFVLLSILAVGMSAVSSLKVSYSAFDKENGPAAQKKQQQ